MAQSHPNHATDVPSRVANAQLLDAMNLGILGLQLAGWAACLAFAPRVHPLLLAAVVVFFCVMMQGVFSMMHECFHSNAHGSRTVNAVMCWTATTIFGASATLIRINHLGHHARNRTRAELVDYIEPGESRLKKTVAYYLAIFGGIWLAGFIGSVLLVVLPSRLTRWMETRGEGNTYAAAFADFEAADFMRIRIEVVCAVLFWTAATLLLDLRWQYVSLFYAAFAFSWSSLQWIYHVRTPLHGVEGTYNLRAPRLFRWLILNFNYNLTHHRNSSLRWQYLHEATDLRQTRPFWHKWVSILKPPVPMPADREIQKTYF